MCVFVHIPYSGAESINQSMCMPSFPFISPWLKLVSEEAYTKLITECKLIEYNNDISFVDGSVSETNTRMG